MGLLRLFFFAPLFCLWPGLFASGLRSRATTAHAGLPLCLWWVAVQTFAASIAEVLPHRTSPFGTFMLQSVRVELALFLCFSARSRSAAADSFELERLSSKRQSYRRTLAQLEEKHAAQSDRAANMMASMAAQVQVSELGGRPCAGQSKRNSCRLWSTLLQNLWAMLARPLAATSLDVWSAHVGWSTAAANDSHSVAAGLGRLLGHCAASVGI